MNWNPNLIGAQLLVIMFHWSEFLDPLSYKTAFQRRMMLKLLARKLSCIGVAAGMILCFHNVAMGLMLASASGIVFSKSGFTIDETTRCLFTDAIVKVAAKDRLLRK